MGAVFEIRKTKKKQADEVGATKKNWDAPESDFQTKAISVLIKDKVRQAKGFID